MAAPQEADSIGQGDLLAPDEPRAWSIERPLGSSAFFLICDHAGRRIPRSLGTLGLPPSELRRHIAWDIGAAPLASMLSEALDATLVLQNYSRLVIDCNRPLTSPDSIVTLSEHTPVPGNRQLAEADARRRVDEVFMPYHERIRAELDARLALARPTILISVHSFTPVFKGTRRPWHAGLLYHRDPRLAHAMIRALRREPGLTIGDNQPYDLSDESDYSVPEYGERRGLAHVELEVRQDLITTAEGQREWASRLVRVLTPLCEEFAMA